MEKIYLILPFPPSVNRLWRTTAKGGMHRSAKYMEWKRHAEWAILQQAKGRKITGPYRLTVNLRRPDKRRRDLDNLFKAVSDSLVHMGVVESDHLCERLEAGWVKSGPECEILLESVNVEQTPKSGKTPNL